MLWGGCEESAEVAYTESLGPVKLRRVLKMRRLVTGLFVIGAIVAGAAFTQHLWLPHSWRVEWHQRWLESGRASVSHRQSLLDQHKRLLEEQQQQYQQQIDEEKVRYQLLCLEYQRLTGQPCQTDAGSARTTTRKPN